MKQIMAYIQLPLSFGPSACAHQPSIHEQWHKLPQLVDLVALNTVLPLSLPTLLEPFFFSQVIAPLKKDNRILTKLLFFTLLNFYSFALSRGRTPLLHGWQHHSFMLQIASKLQSLSGDIQQSKLYSNISYFLHPPQSNIINE